MATYTIYKGLEKPVSTERYNINVANKNSDVIDSELHKLDLKNESQDKLLATKESLNEKADLTALDAHTENTAIHVTQSDKNNWNDARLHAESVHARADATKTEPSETNGSILINGTETIVYTHPEGTNPHGLTKDDIGLGNVENKSSAVIRDELTKENITAALGYTPPATNTDTTYEVVSTTANGLCPKRDGDPSKFLSGDGTWAVPPGGTEIAYSDLEPDSLSSGMTWIGN